jgi:uncharacterized MAPEG superfamily protein
MDAVVVISVLALLQFTWFGFEVGSMRGKFNVKAPAITGDPGFDRVFRVHYNTMEQLAVFLPALWLFAYKVDPVWASGFGIVYLVGRFIYRAAYLKDPASRALGFGMTFLPSSIMLVWVLIAAARGLL